MRKRKKVTIYLDDKEREALKQFKERMAMLYDKIPEEYKLDLMLMKLAEADHD